MARYVDGFVLPVPKKNVEAYRRMARMAGRMFREHGAIEFHECMGDDLTPAFGVPFGRLAKAKPDETVFFSWIVYRSRADRDKVNARVMKDPRMEKYMKGKTMPFDMKRMAYGGFKSVVDL